MNYFSSLTSTHVPIYSNSYTFALPWLIIVAIAHAHLNRADCARAAWVEICFSCCRRRKVISKLQFRWTAFRSPFSLSPRAHIRSKSLAKPLVQLIEKNTSKLRAGVAYYYQAIEVKKKMHAHNSVPIPFIFTQTRYGQHISGQYLYKIVLVLDCTARG